MDPLVGVLINEVILEIPKFLERLNVLLELIDKWVLSEHHVKICLLGVNVFHLLRELLKFLLDSL